MPKFIKNSLFFLSLIITESKIYFGFFLLLIFGCTVTKYQKIYPDAPKELFASTKKMTSDAYAFVSDGNGSILTEVNNQGQVNWSKQYNKFSGISSILANSDGGYTISTGRSGIVRILRTTSNGNIIWKKEYKHDPNEVAGFRIYHLSRANDGDYLGTGFVQGVGEMPCVVKINSTNGNVIWSYWYDVNVPGFSLFRGSNVVQKKSGEIFVCGEILSSGNSKNEGVIFKLANNGNPISLPITYGYQQNDDQFNNLIIRNDEIFVCGVSNNDVLLIKTDDNLNPIWGRIWGGIGIESGCSGALSDNNSIVIQGHSDSFTGSDIDLFISKIDLAGNLLWFKTYGGLGDELSTYDLSNLPPIQTQDGGYLLNGSTKSFGNINFVPYSIKTDNSGFTCNPNHDENPSIINFIPYGHTAGIAKKKLTLSDNDETSGVVVTTLNIIPKNFGNNECSSAELLKNCAQLDFECSSGFETNPLPPCSASLSKSLWYKFEISPPTSGCTYEELHINILETIEACFGIYDTCSGSLLVSGKSGDGNNPPATHFTAAIPDGQVTHSSSYYLQISTNNLNLSSFKVCISTTQTCF